MPRVGLTATLMVFAVFFGAQARASAAPAGVAGDLRARVVTETTLTSAEGRAYRVMVSTPEGPAPDWNKIRETRALAGRLAAAGVPTTSAEFPDEEHIGAAISALNRGVPFALRPAV